LLAPTKPEEAEYDVIVKKMKEHINPIPSTVVQPFRFSSRVQAPEESVAEFVAELRRLSSDCEFGDTLSMMLRDRLVCGVKDEQIQRRLLQDTNLTFDKALSTARAMEIAALNAEEIQRPGSGKLGAQSSATREVHKTEDSPVEPKKRKCCRCLGWHSPEACYFQKVQCHKCQKTDHIARACLSQAKGQQSNIKKQVSHSKTTCKGKATHSVEAQTSKSEDGWSEEEEEEEEAGLYTVHTVGRSPQAATTGNHNSHQPEDRADGGGYGSRCVIIK
jgi:hypothetical protein